MPLVQPDPAAVLEVRDAVLGEGLVLNRTSEGGFVIHSVVSGAPRELGCFQGAIAAWKAVDAVDVAALQQQRQPLAA